MRPLFTIAAPAKINAYLRVRGRRADGYHDIDTVFLPLPGLVDTVSVVPATPGIAFTCDDDGIPSDATNLCCRAADAFARAADVRPAWHIHLEKRIPVAAGLGGGSSDAAAVLTGLNQAHDQPLAPDALHALARDIGADVAYFLNPVPARAGGIGNLCTPVPAAAALPMVLLAPPFPVRASWAYAHWRPDTCPKPPRTEPLLEALAAGDAPGVATCTYNALEHALWEKFPFLEMLRDELLDRGALAVHISGSGPALFGVFESGEREAADAMAQQIPEAVRVLPVRTGTSHGAGEEGTQ